MMARATNSNESEMRTVDMLIVGAGFSGLCMLYKARQLGLTAKVVEAAAGVGGTWYHNCYPGARVDVESMEYSFQFSEELQQEWQWTERYSPQPELLKYANHIADRFEMRRDIELHTRVTAAAFDEQKRRWQITSTRQSSEDRFSGADDTLAQGGQLWSAQFLVMACGPLSSPNTPSFKGLDSFKGPVLHTARWPQHPIDFTGQRVGVIGTGSSGVQSIPLIAAQAEHLTVFQRTATYVVPARNAALDPAYVAAVKADYPGFRARSKQMRTGFGSDFPPRDVSALEVDAEERDQQFEARWKIGGFHLLGAFRDIMTNEEANGYAAQFVRNKILSAVKNPETAKLLLPDQVIGCKRLCVGTDYYETYNRSNVELVDVSQAPVEALTPKGLISGGKTYEFDALVLATGFDAMTGTLMKLDIRGLGGVSIQEKWKSGPLNYLDLTVAGFPNFFNIAGPGSTSAFTLGTLAIEHHVDWIADCIQFMKTKSYATAVATDRAEQDWVAYVNRAAHRSLLSGCNSWYLGANIAGKPRQFMPLAAGFPSYAKRCAEVAEKNYEGFSFA
jgi:cation diffusion facilitator CzcD-associated flavoprotein CzcO